MAVRRHGSVRILEAYEAYLTLGYALNQENSNMGLGNGAAGFGHTPPGSNQFGTTLGIKHIF